MRISRDPARAPVLAVLQRWSFWVQPWPWAELVPLVPQIYWLEPAPVGPQAPHLQTASGQTRRRQRLPQMLPSWLMRHSEESLESLAVCLRVPASPRRRPPVLMRSLDGVLGGRSASRRDDIRSNEMGVQRKGLTCQGGPARTSAEFRFPARRVSLITDPLRKATLSRRLLLQLSVGEVLTQTLPADDTPRPTTREEGTGRPEFAAQKRILPRCPTSSRQLQDAAGHTMSEVECAHRCASCHQVVRSPRHAHCGHARGCVGVLPLRLGN